VTNVDADSILVLAELQHEMWKRLMN